MASSDGGNNQQSTGNSTNNNNNSNSNNNGTNNTSTIITIKQEQNIVGNFVDSTTFLHSPNSQNMVQSIVDSNGIAVSGMTVVSGSGDEEFFLPLLDILSKGLNLLANLWQFLVLPLKKN